MFKTILQIVSSLLFITGIAFAKDYPLQRVNKINLYNYNTTVLEFPFKIEQVKFDKFKRITFVKNEELENKVLSDTDEIKVPKIRTTKIVNGKKVIVTKNMPKQKRKHSKKPLTVKKSKDGNILQITPNMTGSTKVIVWGYSEYPIMIHLTVHKNKSDANDYFNFIDIITPSKEIVKFESSRHETVIKKLFYNAYLNKTPKGYTRTIFNSIEDGKNYILQAVQELQGKKYKLKEYVFTNTSKQEFKLNEKMFYKKGEVYAVSIEKLGKVLKPNEQTRVFIISKG